MPQPHAGWLPGKYPESGPFTCKGPGHLGHPGQLTQGNCREPLHTARQTRTALEYKQWWLIKHRPGGGIKYTHHNSGSTCPSFSPTPSTSSGSRGSRALHTRTCAAAVRTQRLDSWQLAAGAIDLAAHALHQSLGVDAAVWRGAGGQHPGRARTPLYLPQQPGWATPSAHRRPPVATSAPPPTASHGPLEACVHRSQAFVHAATRRCVHPS